jgi:tetraacyldisaccharide 4'-kinase
MREYLYNLATDKYSGVGASLIKAVLWVFSLIYGGVVRILAFSYRIKPQQLNCQVISVGNITLGGTGKTSLVEFINRFLKEKGHSVAILTRGYKRKITSYELRVTSYETMGDEPYMLAKNLGDIPVLVDADRIRAAQLAERTYGVDTVILDDGFQQWRIKKDLEIVTIDATDPFGNGKVLPRGILREPLCALKRADIFVLTKTNLNPDIQEIKDFLSEINPKAAIFEAMHQPVGFYNINNSAELSPPEALKEKNVALVSGIADPGSFENLIASLGINIGLSRRFPDHHRYSPKDLENAIKEAQDKGIDTMVTTEKDAVRLAELGAMISRFKILVLRIELRIKDEQSFSDRLLRLYSA